MINFFCSILNSLLFFLPIAVYKSALSRLYHSFPFHGKCDRIFFLSIMFMFGAMQIPAQGQPPVQGVWEGLLQLKFMWKIDRDNNGNLSAVLNIPDQKTFNVPVQTVVFRNDSLILEINLPGVPRVRFTGRYDRDRRTIDGVYSDGQNSYPMSLTPGAQLLENMAPRVDASGNQVLQYRYKMPQRIDDDWQTAPLNAAGMDSTLLIQLMENILNENFKNIHSVLIVKDDKLVLEEYFYGYKRDQLHFIASVTKSVTGTCAGIACDRNLIKDLNEPLCSYFPEYSNLICMGEKKLITLYHLLSMTAGFQWDEHSISYLDPSNPATAAGSSGDCVKYLFEKPLSDAPGVRHVYNSVLPNTMGEIIKKTSGLRLDQYAEKYLFAPLHIKDYYWEVMSDGRIQAGGGLSLQPRDMMKLTVLYMNKGEYLGQRIVSSDWFEKCDARITHCEGPQYWNHWGPNTYTINGRMVKVFSGAGLGGQWIFGIPALNMAVVFTADFFGSTEFGPQMLERYILPSVVTPAFVDGHPEFGIRIKELPGLKFDSKAMALLGCIKGCLNFMKKPVSDAWLYGATGCAFLINIHENVISYSVGRWNKERFYQLGKNIGYETEHITGQGAAEDFHKQQQAAWDKVRQAIDEGYPCFGYPLHSIPETYLIHGYDHCGYYYNGVGCESGTGPRLWKELGLPDRYFDLHIVRPCEPAPVDKTIKDALSFVIEFCDSPDQWVGAEYKIGAAAYDQWIKALEQEKADAFGAAFNPLVWSECRSHAVLFLAEAKTKVAAELQPTFNEAMRHYQEAAGNLQKVSALFPCFSVTPEQRTANVKNKVLCSQAITCLKAAKEADSEGLESLRRIVAGL